MGGVPSGRRGWDPAVAEPLQEAGECCHDDAVTSLQTRPLAPSFTLVALQSS